MAVLPQAGPPGPANPLPAVPPLEPGTLRRTMHVDVGPRGAWRGALVITGGARDLRVGEGAGSDLATEVLAEAEVEAFFDEQRRLVSLACNPAAAWAEGLLGVRAGGGFRRALAQRTPPAAAGSLLRQVLDDLPAAALISGYAWIRLARKAGHDPATLVPADTLVPMIDLCSGWRTGGVAAGSVTGGRGVPVQDCPAATDLVGDDPLAWHAIAPLGEGWMRRRRLLDVRASASGFEIWAMFRDTVGEADGEELVLHEYAVTVTGVGDRITAVSAEPRVLPFPECPGAAPAVSALAGQRLAQLPGAVPDLLTGISSCTHLNDLLRSLGGADGLVDLARMHAASAR